MSDDSPIPVEKERRGLGLSPKLLLLTVLFVLIAEVLIFVPSISNFRLAWLGDRIAVARTAALVIDAAPDGTIPRELEREVLAHVGAMTISVKQGDTRRLLAFSDMPPMVGVTVDLRETGLIAEIPAAFATLTAGDGRTIRVVGAHPRQGDFIEIVMDETPLRAAMQRFSLNITILSLVISGITAALVYLTMNWMLIRPMRRIHASMMAFRSAPDDASRIIAPSTRRDEVGQTEAELARMQREIHGTLAQKSHLAALGLAVAKINHDLRNMLSSAQLVSDRLAAVKDPTVQRLVPKLLGALDRAITLCQDTLTYGRAVEPAPRRRHAALAGLVDEVGAVLGLGPDGVITWANRVERGLEIDADPDQLFRVLLNLGRNAVQALEAAREADTSDPPRPPDRIAVSARRAGGVVTIEVSDTGPGVPAKLRESLFQAFSGTTRKGGSGLGLAIAAELVKGHGGTITLADGTLGATFLITIPDRPVDLAQARAERARA